MPFPLLPCPHLLHPRGEPSCAGLILRWSPPLPELALDQKHTAADLLGQAVHEDAMGQACPPCSLTSWAPGLTPWAIVRKLGQEPDKVAENEGPEVRGWGPRSRERNRQRQRQRAEAGTWAVGAGVGWGWNHSWALGLETGLWAKAKVGRRDGRGLLPLPPFPWPPQVGWSPDIYLFLKNFILCLKIIFI